MGERAHAPNGRGSRFWWLSVATMGMLLPLLASQSLAAAARSMTSWLEPPVPAVAGVDIYEALFDVSPVALTITAGPERIPYRGTRDQVLTDPTLWRRMHLADWNGVPAPLRERAIDAMLSQYRVLFAAPGLWSHMTAHDWDDVPQPVRVVAYLEMVDYWTHYYAVGASQQIPTAVVADAIAAIIMSESWFNHRATNVDYAGERDFGLAQASAAARERMRRLYDAGEIDVRLEDEDYFNPWAATRFAAIWMSRLLERTRGDLDVAIRAYHRGLSRAFDERGDRYLAAVGDRRSRFILNQAAPAAWDYLWTVHGRP